MNVGCQSVRWGCRGQDKIFKLSRAVAQLGSALDWGSRGRRFKSCQPDRRQRRPPRKGRPSFVNRPGGLRRVHGGLGVRTICPWSRKPRVRGLASCRGGWCIEQESLYDVLPCFRPRNDVPQQLIEVREHDDRIFKLWFGRPRWPRHPLSQPGCSSVRARSTRTRCLFWWSSRRETRTTPCRLSSTFVRTRTPSGSSFRVPCATRRAARLPWAEAAHASTRLPASIPWPFGGVPSRSQEYRSVSRGGRSGGRACVDPLQCR